MTTTAMQSTLKTGKIGTTRAPTEKGFFESVLKKWAGRSPKEKKRGKPLLTPKEVAETYGLSERTLKQLRDQKLGFPTKVIRGVIYYTRKAIEEHYASIAIPRTRGNTNPPCSLVAFVDLSSQQCRRKHP